jgi:imidazolonepropionase
MKRLMSDNPIKYDAIWINACIATCEQGYGLIETGAIAVRDGKIAWIGQLTDLPKKILDSANHIYDVSNRVITPGLIDCHTHIIYAGDRADEFEKRLQGISYEEMVRLGGGIQSTVNATRAASEESLLSDSYARAQTMIRNGTSVIEIKSGYGLNWETELKILRVAKQLEDSLPLTVKKTFLGAHTIPNEYHDSPDDYVDLICDEMIPRASRDGLADAVDVFCEKIAFNIKQTERIFQTAKNHGLSIKCHAEQLSHMGAAALAARYQALSVDHLEHITESDIQIIAQSATVAVLLPGAIYCLNETKRPPVDLLRAHGVPIALATDCNPGTSPIFSLPLIMNMACRLLGLTPEEALLGVTKYAAAALNLESSHGTLGLGKTADMAVWDICHPRDLSYYLGSQPLYDIIKNGKRVLC